MSKQILFLFLIFFVSNKINSQLVNIESRRMQTDSIRFVLKGDLLFNYSNNNNDYFFRIGSSVTTQFKSKDLKSIYFILGNYNLTRSRIKDFQNSWFIHLRFNQKLNNLFRIEAFIQSQNNKLLIIDSRHLIGAGLRLKFISKDQFKAYLGNSYMYEIEKSGLANNKSYNHRNSTYLSFNMNLKNSNIDLTNTIYFQPLYESIRNHRILEQFKVELPISKTLKISGLFNYFYTSETPLGEEDFSSNLNLGLTLEL